MVDFHQSPLIMGVVNVTPDSFSDGGHYDDLDKAIAHTLRLIEEGADIIDLGGESTRPNATPVSIEEEQNRVLPVLKVLKETGVKVPVSIDTRHADTMQKAIEFGADIINDVSALTHDSRSIAVVSEAQIPVILMHMQGIPQTMQHAPRYDDVVQEVFDALSRRIEACSQYGIEKSNIVCDPGIGFGKTLENNLKLLKNIGKFQELGCAIMLGTSRKSFIEKICPGTDPDQRLPGSLASALWGLQNGVNIFRVHDVAETRQAFSVFKNIQIMS